MSNINPPPVEADITEHTEKVRMWKLGSGWLRWLAQAQAILASLQLYGESGTPQSPSTGFVIAAADGKGILLLDPAAGLASGQVGLPPNPIDKQQFQMSTTLAIATVTVTSAAATVKNPTFSMAAGSGATYYYRASNTTWYKIA